MLPAPRLYLLIPNSTELKKINDWPTFPQIIVNGELIGGLDIVKEMSVESSSFSSVVANG